MFHTKRLQQRHINRQYTNKLYAVTLREIQLSNVSKQHCLLISAEKRTRYIKMHVAGLHLFSPLSHMFHDPTSDTKM